MNFDLEELNDMQDGAPPALLKRIKEARSGGGRAGLQSVNLWQAFFQRQAVHHMSRFSIPYTLRHFLPSPRTLRLQRTGGEAEESWGASSGLARG